MSRPAHEGPAHGGPAHDGPAAEESDQLRLGLQVCFQLQNASRAFRGVYRHVLRETGLTYPQYLLMVALWEHGAMPVKRLGELLRLDSGTLSPLLKRLEGAGLVTRERSTRDERSVKIGLTPAGRQLRAPARKIPREIRTATGMDEAELADLREQLRRLTCALDAAADARL